MSYVIKEIRINEMLCPMGIDIERPVFSWKFDAAGHSMKQAKAQILVGSKEGEHDCWDSGILNTDRSIGIRYDGCELSARKRYFVSVRTWNTEGAVQEAKTFFETGLMNPHIEAWEGAQWIGAPEYSLAADMLSVFTIETTLQVLYGTRAGMIFGANDPRLLCRNRNESLLEGKNEIRYVLNLETQPATIEIFRIGYAPGDSADLPYAVFPAVSVEDGTEVITKENRNRPHTLRVEVTGNCAYTWLDGICVDRVERPWFYGTLYAGRQLNPLGSLDITTFPRLNQIGFYVGEGSRAHFDGLRVRYNREPKAQIVNWKPEGLELDGERRLLHDPSRGGLPMLRREFQVEKGLKRARLYAAARGIYDGYMNGVRICEDYFAPGASQFDKHLMYQTYDVKSFLREGKNVLGCILASGWWSDAQTYRLENYNFWGDRPSFLALMVLEYEDDREVKIVSSPEGWEYCADGPCRYAGFFNGEKFDARQKEVQKVFLQPDSGGSAPAVIRPVPVRTDYADAPVPWPTINETEPALVGHFQAPVRAVEMLTAKSMTEVAHGVYVYDLGQEIAGVPKLRLRGEKGQKITIRYGEMLYPDLEEYGDLAGKMLQANLREASSTDEYICSGIGTEEYSPRFTFHGFRYIEISGVTEPPEPSDVQGILLSSVLEMTGKFTCDHALVNKLVSNVSYSQRCNFISVPTDCPQRNERMGWVGDTHVFCRTATYQAQVKNFYLRNLQAMQDLQRADGRLPDIAPVGGGFGGITYESAMVLMVWELYQQYGDEDVIREYYPCMNRWMTSMEEAGFPGLPGEFGLGDWLAPVETDRHLIWNAFYYRNCVLMARFAGLLGKTGDRACYEEKAKQTKVFWNRQFVHENGKTCGADGSVCDTQTSYVIALSCDVMEEHRRRDFADLLAKKTRECGCTVQTGFFGTGPLNPMLSENGYPELAHTLITQTNYPSWLYPVTQGATTIWERWDSYTHERGFGGRNAMNSFNHYSLGNVVSWLYEYVLGIRRDESEPGYGHFTLCPDIRSFKEAAGEIETPYGRVKSGWRLNGDTLVYCCTIPANSSATLMLNGKKQVLMSGKYTFTERMV